MKLSSLLLGIVAAVAVIAILLSVLGVKFHSTTPLQGAALYSLANEVTATGVVTEVQEFDCPVSEGELGDHLLLKTANGVLLIHLAPARVMHSQNLVFSPGDQLKVVGARVRLFGENSLIAQEITRGNESFTFRGHDGKLLMVQ